VKGEQEQGLLALVETKNLIEGIAEIRCVVPHTNNKSHLISAFRLIFLLFLHALDAYDSLSGGFQVGI